MKEYWSSADTPDPTEEKRIDLCLTCKGKDSQCPHCEGRQVEDDRTVAMRARLEAAAIDETNRMLKIMKSGKPKIKRSYAVAASSQVDVCLSCKHLSNMGYDYKAWSGYCQKPAYGNGYAFVTANFGSPAGCSRFESK